MTPGRIVVVSNPLSGRNRRDPGLTERLRTLVPAPHRLAEPDTEAATDALATDLAAMADLAVLAVNGGDGTLSHVLSAYLRARGPEGPMPAVAVLRGGTMNTVAHGIGLDGRPEEILARVVARHREGRPQPVVERHLMRVRDGVGPDRYGFLFGNGLVSNFLEAYYEGGDVGPVKGATVLARAMASALVGGAFARRLTRPVEVQVALDGERWEDERFLAVAVGTVDDLGLGFKPFWRVVDHPGRLQALGFACSPFALAVRIPRTRWGAAWNHPDIVDVLGVRLILRGDGPQAYMIEGDFHRGGQAIEVTVGPPVPLVCG
ncbi:MAG: diacylglycerol kinase [Alphaproteobacteria bacterium]|nr:diacylglycerol kinase [Alphaproteobacteria bacterium]